MQEDDITADVTMLGKKAALLYHPTFNPRSSSLSERRISEIRWFMRSHSWKHTKVYGDRSAVLEVMSDILYSSGSFSSTSSKIVFTCPAEE